MEPKPKFVRPFAVIDEHILHWWGRGLPPYEIAKRVGWSSKAVKSRVKRLRKAGHPEAVRRPNG